MRDIQRLRQIRESCTICNGKGYLPRQLSNSVRLEDCKCVQKISWEIKLIDANIPEKYRTWDFRGLTKDFLVANKENYVYLKTYLENIEAHIKNGKGFWFSSPPGQAKSAIVSYFLREAIKKGFSGYYTRASHLITKKFEAIRDPDAKEFIDSLLNETDIIVIEELEKVYLLTELDMPNQLFFEFLSDLYDKNITVILTSNESRKNIFKRFPVYVQDRLATLKYMTLKDIGSGRRKFG